MWEWEIMLMCGLSVSLGWVLGVYQCRRGAKDDAVDHGMGEYYLDGDHRKQFRWREELKNVVRSERTKKSAELVGKPGFTDPIRKDSNDKQIKVGDSTPSESSSTT